MLYELSCFSSWVAAENACTIALGQQKSSKAYYRRAKARKMQGRIDEAELGIVIYDHNSLPPTLRLI